MSSKKRKIFKYTIIVAVIALVGIQFIPVEGIGVNPQERFDLEAPPEVEAILRKACFDCHTNETRWPWYARIAPGSWLLMRDVNLGRNSMNFSEWAASDPETRAYDLETSWEQIEEGLMPPWFYIYPLHMDAKLTDDEKATLKGWLLKPIEEEEEEDAAEEGEEADGEANGEGDEGEVGTEGSDTEAAAPAEGERGEEKEGAQK